MLTHRASRWGNIGFRRGCRVTQIMLAADEERVCGVAYVQPDGIPATVSADLVVDASGRSDLTMACQAAIGMPPPRLSVIGVDIGYATGVFDIPHTANIDFVGMVTHAAAPESSRAGYMLQIGDERWQVLLMGRDDERPPGEIDGFLGFARSLATPTIGDMLRNTRLVDDIARFRIRESVWRHYDPANLPAGLLPIGDSLCRFNPIYGQGMSVAAQEAVLLRELLMSRVDAPSDDFVGEFLTRAQPLIEVPWQMSAIPDLAYPQTIGERPDDLDEQLAGLYATLQQAMSDPEAHRALVEARHLVPPGSLARRQRLELI